MRLESKKRFIWFDFHIEGQECSEGAFWFLKQSWLFSAGERFIAATTSFPQSDVVVCPDSGIVCCGAKASSNGQRGDRLINFFYSANTTDLRRLALRLRGTCRSDRETIPSHAHWLQCTTVLNARIHLSGQIIAVGRCGLSRSRGPVPNFFHKSLSH